MVMFDLKMKIVTYDKLCSFTLHFKFLLSKIPILLVMSYYYVINLVGIEDDDMNVPQL